MVKYLLRSASFFKHFLSTFFFTTYKDAPGSFFIFPNPILESSIFPWSLYSFYYRMVLTNLDLYTNCAHWYWRVIGSGDLFLDRAKNYMCISYPVFIYISRNSLDGNDFMDMIPKTEAKKKKENTDKLDLIKLKRENVCASKNTIKEATIWYSDSTSECIFKRKWK